MGSSLEVKVSDKKDDLKKIDKKKEESCIEELPLLAVRDIVMFPKMTLSVFVGRENSLKNLEYASENKKRLFVVTQKNSSIMKPIRQDLFNIGTVSTILQVMKFNDNTIRVTLGGNYRAHLSSFKKVDDVQIVSVKTLDNPKIPGKKNLIAINRALLQEFKKYAKLDTEINPDIQVYIKKIVDSEKEILVQTIIQALNLDLKDCQLLLKMNSIEEQARFLIKHLRMESDILSMKKKIQGRIRTQIDKTQKEYYLNEQLKAIQKELGIEDSKNSSSILEKKLLGLNMPQKSVEHFKIEINKLKNSNSISTEAVIIQNYLDLALSLPWKKYKKSSCDILEAEKVLDSNHYGMRKVKDRILEYLAVRKYAGDKSKSPILCLVGPPGVGKTSLGESIASAINKDFIRISLGGVRDEAEIRGHRKTYVGAMPGKIIQSLRKVNYSDPVIMLDEIDKISSDYKGDPSSALLEVLDPEQNSKFVDHYLEVEYDLSKVMFICTANNVGNIPFPLLDRTEIVRLSSYTEQEKLKIALIHLIKKQMRNHNLSEEKFKISEEAVKEIVVYYTREAGVRNLERQIAKICRKVVRRIVKNELDSIDIVTPADIHVFLGKRKFSVDKKNDSNILGITNGLAWTEAGGDLLVTEAVANHGKGKVIVTGHLGDVMKESAHVAFACVKALIEKCPGASCYTPEKLMNLDFHIHVPAGAIPKDGPSAGITLATSLASLVTKISVNTDVAMTGELSLVGRVLPIGGLKEKIIAAHRAFVFKVIIPEENLKDLEDIPSDIKKDIEIIPVKNILEVFRVALPGNKFL